MGDEIADCPGSLALQKPLSIFLAKIIFSCFQLTFWKACDPPLHCVMDTGCARDETPSLVDGFLTLRTTPSTC